MLKRIQGHEPGTFYVTKVNPENNFWDLVFVDSQKQSRTLSICQENAELFVVHYDGNDYFGSTLSGLLKRMQGRFLKYMVSIEPIYVVNVNV